MIPTMSRPRPVGRFTQEARRQHIADQIAHLEQQRADMKLRIQNLYQELRRCESQST
jgi:hypothetical protein